MSLYYRFSRLPIKTVIISVILLGSAAYFILLSRISLKKPVDIETLDQKDKILLDYIRASHLFRPSRLPYNFPNDTVFDELIGTQLLPESYKSNPGFFLEAGAYDGRSASFSLKLEMTYGWTGLLVECNPELIPKIKSLHRKAYFADVCLSRTTRPKRGVLTIANNSVASSSLGNDSNLFPDFAKDFTTSEIQTIPLYSLLAAIGVKVVDFAVLDVQSLEYDVLRNFPFDLIFVKIWLVEFDLLSESDRESMEKLMVEQGYNNSLPKFSTDYMYIHNSVLSTWLSEFELRISP